MPKDYTDPETCISSEPRNHGDLTGLIADVDLELTELEARRVELLAEKADYQSELAAMAA